MGFVFDVGDIVKLLDNYSFVPQFFVIWGLFCRLNIIYMFLAKFQKQIFTRGLKKLIFQDGINMLDVINLLLC
jgi:hypothetical protein